MMLGNIKVYQQVLRTVAPNRMVFFPVCGHVGFVTRT